MNEIRLYIKDDEVNQEYIDNLLFLLSIYPYQDDMIKQSIEERLNIFTKKYVNISDIKKEELISLYYDSYEMINGKKIWLIDSDHRV